MKLNDTAKLARLERALLPHLDAAYNLARWLTGTPQDAEDAVQEACVRAVAFFDSFRGEDGRAWLLAIVRNSCYDWLRKNRKDTLIGGAEALETADGSADPEELQLRAADRELVRRCLERLPAEHREVLVLRELEGMSYREIATVAGVPIGTVMSRLARGRIGLRTLLAAALRKETS